MTATNDTSALPQPRNERTVMATACLLPLPGSPGWQGNLTALTDRLEQEVYALTSAGVDAILLQNSWDGLPYTATTLPEASVAMFTRLALQVRQLLNQHPRTIRLGISVLPNHPQVAAAIAVAAQADFIHVPTLVGSRITEAGILSGQLHELTKTYQQLHLPPQSLPLWVDVTENHLIPALNGKRPWESAAQYLHHVARNALQQNRSQANACGLELSVEKLLLPYSFSAPATESLTESLTGSLAEPLSEPLADTAIGIEAMLNEESPLTQLIWVPQESLAENLTMLKAAQASTQSNLGLALVAPFRKAPLHPHDAMPAMDAFKVEQWCHEFKTGKTILETTADAGNAAIKEYKARQQQIEQTDQPTNMENHDGADSTPAKKCPFSGLSLPGFGSPFGK